MIKEVERFLIVWDVTSGKAAGSFSSTSEASKFARVKAENNIGDTFIVFEPKEAYRASATVSNVYLSWPSTAPETDGIEQPTPVEIT